MVKPSELTEQHVNRRSGTCDCASFQSWCQDTSHAATSKPASPHLLEPPSNQKRALRGAGEVLVGLAQLDAGVSLGLHIVDVAARLRLWRKEGFRRFGRGWRMYAARCSGFKGPPRCRCPAAGAFVKRGFQAAALLVSVTVGCNRRRPATHLANDGACRRIAD